MSVSPRHHYHACNRSAARDNIAGASSSPSCNHHHLGKESSIIHLARWMLTAIIHHPSSKSTERSHDHRHHHRAFWPQH
eukprot:3934132-Rhodomonas_salina.3